MAEINRFRKYVIIFFFLCSCSGKFSPPVLNEPFDGTALPPAPDYSKEECWAALPDKKDFADVVPSGCKCQNGQKDAKADVFFIYPTLYLRHTEKSKGWNADISDEAVNKDIEERSIKNQATVFNGAGKIYSPRYRQVFISSYFTKDKESKKSAFDTAYSDVKRAFQYYLDHYNNNRPFIIASHSQGSTHAIRLLKDFFDGTPLQEKLIAAYVVGMDVYDTLYSSLKVCRDSDETGCYISWRTFAEGYFPAQYAYIELARPAVAVNPLTWTTEGTYASYDLNKGGVLRNFDKIIPGLSDARVADGVVRINKPHFFGNVLFRYKNYHIVDYNLFWMNIRENAEHRVKKYFESKPTNSTTGN